jgi:glutamine amidotransferase
MGKTMRITIIDYGAGNIQSIRFALRRLGYEAVLSSNAEEIRTSDKVIFPGVGEASSAMLKLRSAGLDKVIPELRQPVLGICLGMQLMCNSSVEGETSGLGIFDVDVIKFAPTGKVPQIGWNQITHLRSDIFREVPDKAYIYLVHSYYAPLCEATIAESEYGVTYSAALGKENFYGTQFHPEKSALDGERILRNFIENTK